MKKLFLALVALTSLSACTTPNGAITAEDARLKQTYSNCINQAEGNLEQLAACRPLLDELKQSEQHRAFADQESVRVFDYQQCIEAMKSGSGDAYQQQCGKVWQEIKNNNN